MRISPLKSRRKKNEKKLNNIYFLIYLICFIALMLI